MSAVDEGVTAEHAALGDDAPVGEDAARRAVRRAERAERLRWAPWVLLLLVASFVLRVWGAKQGLPYAYNADENAHFVPKAIGLFDHGWNPHYFVNPPAYTYVLHLVFDVWFGGRAGVSASFAKDPTDVFLVARVVSAAFGTAAVWFLYLAGAKLFADRRVGFLAAGLLGVGFLPVFYSHLALNDVPTLAPICLALYGVAGIVRQGRVRDFLLGRDRPRAGVRDEVHGRDRAAADPRGGRRLAVRAAQAARDDARRRAVPDGAVRADRVRRRSTPTPCSTSAGSGTGSTTRRRSPTTRWASSG